MAASLEKARKWKYLIVKRTLTETNESSESLATDSHITASVHSTVKNQPPIKRRSFSMKEKLQILKCLDTESINSICTKFSLHQSVLRKWQQKKAEMKKICQKENLQNRKKNRTAADVDFDNALYVWFLQARTSGIPISMSLLQRKALSLNAELGGNKNFKASNGWFYRWKLRKGIRRLTVTDEKFSADTEAADQDKIEFSNLLKDQKLTRAQIFNFDETGLWYKTLPNKTPAAMHEHQAPGFKNQKERLTIGACCNADGSLKLPLVVIGKWARPRAFKNIKTKNLPVSYKHQKNALMDSDIFTDWFRNEFVPRVKTFLREKNLPLKASLVVNNCRAHPLIKVDDIDTGFLPPNVTSLIQPLNQGILETLKRRYKIQLVSAILNEQERNNTPINVHLKKITIKDVIEWIDDSWKQISPTTIYKCWSKIWPSETRSIATQAEEKEETILTLSSPRVGSETEDIFIHEPEKTTEIIFEMMKQIRGYEMVNEKSVQEWIKRVEDLDESSST